MARVIILTDSVIDRMISDPDFAEYSCIANPPRYKHGAKIRTKGCGGCRKKKRKVQQQLVAGAVDHNGVKRAILELSKDQVDALKEKLKCTSIKVQVRDHRKTISHSLI